MSTKEQGLADTIMAMQEPERLRAENERLRAENANLRAALTTIASFDDLHGTRKLAATGSYGGFDEPESTKLARATLAQCSNHQ